MAHLITCETVFGGYFWAPNSFSVCLGALGFTNYFHARNQEYENYNILRIRYIMIYQISPGCQVSPLECPAATTAAPLQRVSPATAAAWHFAAPLPHWRSVAALPPAAPRREAPRRRGAWWAPRTNAAQNGWRQGRLCFAWGPRETGGNHSPTKMDVLYWE